MIQQQQWILRWMTIILVLLAHPVLYVLVRAVYPPLRCRHQAGSTPLRGTREVHQEVDGATIAQYVILFLVTIIFAPFPGYFFFVLLFIADIFSLSLCVSVFLWALLGFTENSIDAQIQCTF